MNDTTPHFVYRCYDADGVLLYVGCTEDAVARMNVHASNWQNPASAHLNLYMDRYEVEGPLQGREAGRKREREVIGAEAPLLNVHHNKGRGLPRGWVQVPTTPAARTEFAKQLDDLFGGAA